MPEHIRALAFILVMATAVFALAKKPASDSAIATADYMRRCGLWYAITLAAFLTHNYWLFALVSGAVLLVAGIKERNVVALFVFILFAVPAFRIDIPAPGGLRYLFELDYLRILSLALLLPAFLALRFGPGTRHGRWLVPDFFVAGYLAIQLVLQAQVDTFTNVARYAFLIFLDVVLPYYVASRALRDVAAFREVAMSFVLGAMVLAILAMYEGVTNWTVYNTISSVLGAGWGYGGRLGRSGWLRAASSTGHPIALGYVMLVALVLLVYLRRCVHSQTIWWAGFVVLSGGLLASVSRGPWVAAVAALVVYRLAGPKAIGGMLKAGLVVGVIAGLIVISPIGAAVIDLLPFVGTVEVENIDYRQRLLEVSIKLIWQQPWFGVPGYYNLLVSNDLVIGGMVDVVNTYVGIGLANGVIALACFVGAFVSVAVAAYRAMQRLTDSNAEVHVQGCVVLACIAGTMITIFTTSSITVIPVVYWTVVGLGAGYVATLRQQSIKPAPNRPSSPFTNHAQVPLPGGTRAS